VYMSDEDEDIDPSIVIEWYENGDGGDVPPRWSHAVTKPVCIVH